MAISKEQEIQNESLDLGSLEGGDFLGIDRNQMTSRTFIEAPTKQLSKKTGTWRL